MSTRSRAKLAISRRPEEIPGHVLTEDGFFAPKDFLSVPEEEKKKICNGVGGEHGLSKYAPDTVYLLNVRQAADIHDYEYHIGGTKEQKFWADVAFFWNCELLVSKGFGWLYALRMHRIEKYFWAVRAFGWVHFAFHR